MKLHAAHYWTSDGRVVVEIRDREQYQEDTKFPERQCRGTRKWRMPKPLMPKLMKSVILPRGTTGTELKLAKKTLIMVVEVERA